MGDWASEIMAKFDASALTSTGSSSVGSSIGTSDALKWEVGSNLSIGIALTGMDALRERWLKLNQSVQLKVIPKVLRAGAEVMKARLEAATPIGKPEYFYETGTWKNMRGVGQARARVIIYERRQRGLFTSAEEQSLLIGYEKKHAFYMYWIEKGYTTPTKRKLKSGKIIMLKNGGRRIEARGFARNAFDGATAEALSAMDAAHVAAMAEEDHL